MGKVVHFEVPFDDAERALAFYRDVFGWQITSMPEMQYNLVSTGPTGEDGGPTEPGYIGGGMMSRADSPSPGPILVLDVEDIDQSLATIEGLGGEVVVGRTPVGEMGWSAYFRDSEGNLMGLWESQQPG